MEGGGPGLSSQQHPSTEQQDLASEFGAQFYGGKKVTNEHPNENREAVGAVGLSPLTNS